VSPGRWTRSLTRAEWRRLGWFAAAITLGYFVVALFLVMWAGSVSIWKLRRIDRWGG
jgi:high-affinity nickel permease